MPRTVALSHPAPLLCLHRTPGQARVDYVQVTTPVVLPEADPDAFEPAAAFGPPGASGRPVHVYEGGLWVRETATVETLVAEMETPAIGRRAYPMLSYGALDRTPLCAFWPEVNAGRGQPAGTRKVRTVVADLTERARADAAAFVANNLRTVDGSVYRRIPGPLAVHAGTNVTSRFRVYLGEFRFRAGSAMEISAHVVTPRADRVGEFWDFERAFYAGHYPDKLRIGMGERPLRLDGMGLDGLIHLGNGDEDLLAFACDAPGVILRNLSPRALALPGVRGAAERLHAWVALGGTGAVRFGEAEAAIAAACGLVEAVRESDAHGELHLSLEKLAAYGREIALPRLRAAITPVPPEDETALAVFGLRI